METPPTSSTTASEPNSPTPWQQFLKKPNWKLGLKTGFGVNVVGLIVAFASVFVRPDAGFSLGLLIFLLGGSIALSPSRWPFGLKKSETIDKLANAADRLRFGRQLPSR